MSDGPEGDGTPPGQRTDAGIADTLQAAPSASPNRSSGVLPDGTLLEGTYRVKRLIGQGAMGAVYLVEHVALGKEFAAKIVSGSRSMDPAAVTRLRNEARMASAIEHENIVSVTHLGETSDGNVFVVMELLRGEDLRKRLERQLETAERGGAPWIALDDVRAIVEPVLGALVAAHQAGIVHRDLKPDNVFLAQKRGRVVPKIVDFGIGKLRSPGEGDLRLTATGQIVGTPLYMAPEQTRSGSLVDHRADVYAVGVVMFEMLCGRVPFDASNFYELVLRHATEAPPDPRSIRAEIPASVAAVVLRCLEKKPEDRWASAEALLEAWRAAWSDAGEAYAHTLPPPARREVGVEAGGGSGVGSSAPRAGVSTSAPREVPIPPAAARPARPWIAIAAVVAIAIAIGGAVVVVSGGGGAETDAGASGGERGRETERVAAEPSEGEGASAGEGAGAGAGAGAGEGAGARAETVVRTIASDPPGADVLREGSRIGQTPLEVEIGDAPISLELRRAGYAIASVTVDRSSPERVEVTLRRRSGATKGDPGAFPGLAPR